MANAVKICDSWNWVKPLDIPMRTDNAPEIRLVQRYMGGVKVILTLGK